MFELKHLEKEAIPAALEKAKQYRLLNEPSAAQSICLDILDADPDNQDALVLIVLVITDRLTRDYAVGDLQLQDYLSRIRNEYDRSYYTGIIYERRAKAMLKKNPEGGGPTIFELFRNAMEWFEKADTPDSPRRSDAKLRWNQCARIIMSNDLTPTEQRFNFDYLE